MALDGRWFFPYDRQDFSSLLFMSRVCDLTGKRPLTGNNVSHSNVKTKRRQMPNLHPHTMNDASTGKKIRLLLSARGLRTLTKRMGRGMSLREALALKA